ncbi:AraC family transcriptional regulator [Paraflavitalea pollutisoli]|uniref:AraC family transcriptional regulator n=1 Tax=Paraflavitalea pollutisoli TaxID=3034143 RepID=UPI0023EBA39D|nr:helix-turn-helix transcriptional regulator [Paraflavitalea sp. H1-2-19X]
MNTTSTIVKRPATHTAAFRFEAVDPAFEPLTVHSLEFLAQHPAAPAFTQERLRHFEMIWIKKGQASLSLYQQQHILPANTIACLAPEQIRRLHLPADTVGYYLKLTPELLNSFDSTKFPLLHSIPWNHPLIVHTGHGVEQAEEVLLTLARETWRQEAIPEEVASSYVRILMIYINRHCACSANSITREAGLMKDFIALVKSHYAEMKSVNDYASKLGVTPGYLSRMIKRVSGLPASYHIRHWIILEAKRMAESSPTSLKEIAYALGFEDNAHFSKFFKSYAGVNFTSYRRSPIDG